MEILDRFTTASDAMRILNNERAAKPRETVDELVEAVMDLARENSHSDAEIFIADRIRKHITPYITEASNQRDEFMAAALATLAYVDNLNEGAPHSALCNVCTDNSVPYRYKAELCWIHQLQKIVKGGK